MFTARQKGKTTTAESGGSVPKRPFVPGYSLVLFLVLASIRLFSQASPGDTPKTANGGPQPDIVITHWLAEHAIPIKSLEAGNGFADLQQLRATLANVRVVGLGEATHGTREFFQFKHRMVEFLVREMDFNVFALEASYANCLKVNDYVSGGKTSRPEALQALGFLVWQTEEVAALLDWLRSYNQTVPPERKVKFYGYDMQDMSGVWMVPQYLQRVAPEKAKEVNATLMKIAVAIQKAVNGPKEELKALQPAIDQLISYFVMEEGNFIYKTSRAEYEERLHRLRLLAQAADVFSQDWNDTRDRYMAENIVYLLNHERPGTRVAVWAHNAHISTGEATSLPGGGKAMGAYLRQYLGSAYYAFGFAFYQGSFQAMASMPNGDTSYVEYTVGPAGGNSWNWYLAQSPVENYIIDFRGTVKEEAVQQWLNTPRGLGWIGGYNVPANFSETWAAGNFLKSELGKEFDGMVFIRRTTRARPLAKEMLKQN